MTLHRRTTRGVLLGMTALAGALAVVASPAAAQQNSYHFDVPAQPLGTALREYSRAASLQVIFVDEDVRGRRSPALSGTYSAEEALQVLLAGTDLKVSRTALGVVQVAADPGPQDESAERGGAEVEALIVTAQKKDEDIQDVPIAISAFTQKTLDAQKIEGGFDLLKAVPNVTFSKTNFSSYNFQIRGIGTQAISATTDPAVAVSFNNTTLIVNRLFEQEYVDVERVEVLRGPQGTLYGRNATSGVINVISAKPAMGDFFGEIKLEGGNYNAQRLRGHINVPIGETFALRGAYASTKRDGYGFNEFDGSDVDDRDLWTGRITAAWEPNDRFRTHFMWERFEEDDKRVRTSKQLCHRDPSPEDINGVGTAVPGLNPRIQEALLSQGCQPGSLYADEAFGTVNGASLPYVTGPSIAQAFGELAGNSNFGIGPNPWFPHTGFGATAPVGLLDPATAPCPEAARYRLTYTVNVCNLDPYGGKMQSRDLRSISSEIEPRYLADSDVFEFAMDFEVTEALTLSSQTVYAKDSVWATQDYNRFSTEDAFFSDASQACGWRQVFGQSGQINCTEDPNFGRGTFLPLQDLNGDNLLDRVNLPLGPGQTVDANGFIRDADGRRVGYYAHFFGGGIHCDPQLGCSDKLVVQDLSRAESEQFNQEFRLASSFDGPWNFSLGANYTKFETFNDYFVFSNVFNALLHMGPFTGPGREFSNPGTRCGYGPVGTGERCIYVDPNPLESLDGEGHNYFRSANPYELTSTGLFGELYWNVTETLKLTAGGRMTWDQKVFTPIPSQLLLFDYREMLFIGEGDPPPGGLECNQAAQAGCPFAGNAPGGKGSPASPDVVQTWREPTGRLVLDWKPDLGLSWVNDSMFYASVAHGYKGGGANPPTVAPPAGNLLAYASGSGIAPTFDPEFVNAFELGSKNTLFDGALTLNGGGFYYDYTNYQVSKIVDRTASNENFDAKVWGLELEGVFAATRDLRFNFAFGYLNTEIAEGETSIDLMDRAAGGDTSWTTPDGVTWNGYSVVKPWLAAASNCVVPTQFLMGTLQAQAQRTGVWDMTAMCPVGNVQGGSPTRGTLTIPYFDDSGAYIALNNPAHDGRTYNFETDAPNRGAGFAKELGGNELPNAPHYTASVGAQYRMALPGGWDATLRGDFYWQSQSYARVYNTQYDKLRAWTNTNVSLWVEQSDWGVTAEVYVKNLFDEMPITGAFLNSDDSGLTTNVFTLDPRLVGVSVRKSF